MLAPIAIFAFNRPQSLRTLLDALRQNESVKLSDLHIFVDGARPGNTGDIAKVWETQEVATAAAASGDFKNVSCQFAEQNQGLASSIIGGVSQVLKICGKAIVLEDDLVPAPNFLRFMNRALDLYRTNEKIFSICGYNNKVQAPEGYPFDAYACTRSSSWGWATWRDRWESVDWELSNWERQRKNKKAFNAWGGSDCFKMLNDWHTGKISSWAIRFCYAQFLQGKLSVFPLVSKIRNNGFNADATNTRSWSRFVSEFDTSGKTEFAFPQDTRMNQELFVQAMRYHSIRLRLWSRVMYLWHGRHT
jgi:hypothetical protein